MLPTKFQFIWLRVFRGEDQNVKSKRMTDDGHQVMAKAHIAFLPSFSSFGQAVSEEKIFKNRSIRNKNCLWRPCL